MPNLSSTGPSVVVDLAYFCPVSPVSKKYIRYAVSSFFVGLTVFLGYYAQRADFIPLITVYGVFFGLYLWVVFSRKNISPPEVRWYVGLGIALRILLLFNIPNLSDDIYRFLWDGRLTVAGIHPFAHPPVYFIENQIFPKGITSELLGKLNSPEYFTVYPPVCQAVFALAAWLSPANEQYGMVVIKLFLLVCEVGTLWQLAAGDWQSAASNAQCSSTHLPLLYALNPLIIIEVVGNCHFEGAMIFFLLAGLRALRQNKIKPAALWWALATASKLLPLMFLPIVWRWLGWRKGLVFTIVFGGICLALFAPLLSVLFNIVSSLDLYFRQFQFNASVYYLLRAAGFWVKGFDVGETLGPFLAATTVLGVGVIAWKTKPSKFLKLGRFSSITDAMLFALMLQLSLSATVHPWYATVPLALGVVSGWRFPIVWSGMVALSYSHYDGGFLQENYWLISLEYSALWLFIIWETNFIGRRRSQIASRHSFPPSPTK